MVKVEPRPGSLATVMSPPIIWQKRRLIARPSPVPPYLRVVEASAWTKSWKSLPICSGVMPMPVSVTAIVTHSRPASMPRLRADGHRALLGELVGVAREVEQRLPDPRLVGAHRAEVGGAIDHHLVAVLRRHRADGLHHVLDQRRDREGLDVEVHLAGLDLGQIEDVVDQREQVLGRAQHALERLELVVALQVDARPRAASRSRR